MIWSFDLELIKNSEFSLIADNFLEIIALVSSKKSVPVKLMVEAIKNLESYWKCNKNINTAKTLFDLTKDPALKAVILESQQLSAYFKSKYKN